MADLQPLVSIPNTGIYTIIDGTKSLLTTGDLRVMEHPEKSFFIFVDQGFQYPFLPDLPVLRVSDRYYILPQEIGSNVFIGLLLPAEASDEVRLRGHRAATVRCCISRLRSPPLTRPNRRSAARLTVLFSLTSLDATRETLRSAPNRMCKHGRRLWESTLRSALPRTAAPPLQAEGSHAEVTRWPAEWKSPER